MIGQWLLFVSFAISTTCAHSFTFIDAAKAIESHDSVDALLQRAKSLEEEGDIRGSWGDPKLKMAAKNYPVDSFNNDQTPMTGIEFGLSQKIALTNRYGKIENSFDAMADSQSFASGDQKRLLIKALWDLSIDKKGLIDEKKIIEENLSWVEKMLAVSNKLYANGKVNQQSLLEIQIRKSELEIGLNNVDFGMSEIAAKLSYLIGKNGKTFEIDTVPWKLLEAKAEDDRGDYKLRSLEMKALSSKEMLKAQRLSYIPDLNISVGYTKRANIDKKGDFLSAMITFPLPLSSDKYSKHAKAGFKRAESIRGLRNYQKKKKSNVELLGHQIEKIQMDLEILSDKSIIFARNSRKITTKSYSLGGSSYIELLQAELKLQKLLLRRVKLSSVLDRKKVQLTYLTGGKLYE
ncbi:MAG: TolC family protein [Bacteriovoracaceae bacterium]|nr:TolC family protein [Bacteriovoracaceae bacterium]